MEFEYPDEDDHNGFGAVEEFMYHYKTYGPLFYPEPLGAMSHTKVFEAIAPELFHYLVRHDGCWWMDIHYYQCGYRWTDLSSRNRPCCLARYNQRSARS